MTIVSVVAVHSTWYMANGGHWVSSGIVLAILHYTRESFMALTGFVLTYSLFGKSNRWTSVWSKRYKLVLFPYLIWSAAYILLLKGGYPGFVPFIETYGRDLLDGGAWFHLYYLLITMQFYLILPLFLWLMKLAKKHPVWVVLVAVAFQMALMAYDQYARGAIVSGFINHYAGDEVWTYTAYFVLGGVAAVHWQEVRQWLQQHLATIVWWSLAAAGIMWVQFFLQTYWGHDMLLADSVIQPAMVPWALMSIVLLAAIGVRYENARVRIPGRWSIVKLIADLSFGIYLVHPMLLQYWTDLLAHFGFYHPSFYLDAITVALLVSASMVLMLLIGMTPFSPWIIGRAARKKPSSADVTEKPSPAATRAQQL